VISTDSRTKRRVRHAAGPARARTGLGEAGQALVEVAIALPILLALLVGIFEFARAYNIQQVITNAAREGAREGVVDDTNPTTIAVTRATARLSDANISGATVNATCAAPCDTGTEFTVSISVPYTFVFIGPVLSLFSGGVDDGMYGCGAFDLEMVEFARQLFAGLSVPRPVQERLLEAILLTEKSEVVRKALGEHVFNAFIENKKIEWDRYRVQVTNYELEKYLPVL